MRVALVRGGGLAGTVVTITVDTGALSDAEAADLRARVGACRFATDHPTGAGADRMRSELRVTDDSDPAHATGRAAEPLVVRFDEGDAPPELGELVTWVLSSPHGERQVGRAAT